jgi:hypothetical protein
MIRNRVLEPYIVNGTVGLIEQNVFSNIMLILFECYWCHCLCIFFHCQCNGKADIFIFLLCISTILLIAYVDVLCSIMHLTGQLDPTHYMPIKFYFTGMAWSPHHHGLLVSGGGKNDTHLNFWNISSGKQKCIYTGSQVSNIAWSGHSSQLVSNWHIKLVCSSIHEIVLLLEVGILFIFGTRNEVFVMCKVKL